VPNVLLTTRCDRRCDYCFAGGDDAPEQLLSRDELVTVADFLALEGDGRRPPRISLLGGEPSLHPDFELFVRYLAQRGFLVRVFTHGGWPPALVDTIARHVPPERLHLVVNVDGPGRRRTGRLEPRAAALLERLGAACVLSVNLDRPGLPRADVLAAYAAWPLRRTLRVGLAQPILGGANAHPATAALPAIAADVVALAEDAAALSVRLSLDCGFPQCAFDDAGLGVLFRHGARLRFRCEPVLDIGPGLEVWPCFPLRALTVGRLTDFESVAALRRAAAARIRAWAPAAPAGIHADCEGCAARSAPEPRCAGGCRARVLGAVAAGAGPCA
jgi:hypothetical protein